MVHRRLPASALKLLGSCAVASHFLAHRFCGSLPLYSVVAGANGQLAVLIPSAHLMRQDQDIAARCGRRHELREALIKHL
jgi:hypothetical protein